MKNLIGIYKITSPSNRIYIGRSWNIEKRFYTYRHRANSKQVKLFSSFSKHGVENHLFEILELLENCSQLELDEKEIFYWNKFRSEGFQMLNLKEPGSHGKHSEETKQKMRMSVRKKVTLKYVNRSKMKRKELIERQVVKNLGFTTEIMEIIDFNDLREF